VSIAELAIRKRTVTWSLSVAVLILGWLAFSNLPRLMEPDLSVREALVVTPYPGASAKEVEQDVSDRIERSARELDQLRRVESYSSRGLSIVRVIIRDEHDGRSLPQVWAELRNKIDAVQSDLPPRAGPSMVDDDFGDIYGAYYALVGAGFSESELRRVAELLRQKLGALDGVKKTILFGEQQDTIFVEVSKAEMKALGVGFDQIFDALRSKNLPADAGRILVGPEQVPIYPSGLYRSEQDFGDLMIAAGKDRLIRLGDIAEIRRGYEDHPSRLLRVDGSPAVGIAVKMVRNSDLVAVGEAVEHSLTELESEIPLGMELKVIALQPAALTETIDSFLSRLALAFAIVIATLAFFMGLRSGLIVGFVTLLNLAGTLAVMDTFQIGLNSISMGALIIALGLLTDNAIVVVDGIKVRMGLGMGGLQAVREVVSSNTIPLLVATSVAALAFASIGSLNSSAGEYTGALCLVILIALPISWITAITIAPMLAERFLEHGAPADGDADPYGGHFYRFYAKIVAAAIRRRRPILTATTLLLALSLYGLRFVPQIYFPGADTPTFLVEIHFREGTHIRETERRMDEIQTYLSGYAEIIQVATAIGESHPRHLPIHDAEPYPRSHYSVSLVSVDDHRRIDEIRSRIQSDLEERFPDAVVNVKKYAPGAEMSGGRIRLRISGPDPAELRRLADAAEAVITSDPDAKAVRDGWGAKVKVARPVLAQERARRLRVDRKRISDAMRTTYSGTLTGFYREGSELIPIVVRVPREERSEVEDMADILVTSPLRGDQVPMLQIVDRLETITEDARRYRRDRRPTITVHADANRGPTLELFKRIKPRVEKTLDVDGTSQPARVPALDFALELDANAVTDDVMLPLTDRPGYFLSWGGDAESYMESQARLAASVPVYFGLMALVTVALFNSLRQPLIVLLTAPLSLIGVTAFQLLTGQPFGFMSLLGVVVLSGLLMKYTILIVDRIARETATGKARAAAILDAGRSLLRPVTLAAGTTILAILPLLRDDLFRSMAATATAGLGVGTLLSLVLVPVLYAAILPVGDKEAG